jgi:hypothetical protein
MPATHRPNRYVSIALIILASVSLFLAQSAYWVNHTVFNQQNFTQITTTALLSESSRDAIASSVVNQSLENRPVIKRLVGERAESLISGLLGSDLSSQAVTAVTAKTYAYTTSSNRQDIAIDLTGIKTPITTIIGLAESTGVNVPKTQIELPDQVVLLQSDAFPNLSGAVKAMLWLGPLFWLGAIGSFGLYIYLGRRDYARRIYMVGAAVFAVGIFGLLLMPFVPPPVAAAIPNIDLRPVAESLTAGFLAPFQTQMYYMLGINAVILLVVNQRFNILAAFRSVSTRVNPSRRN